MPLVVFEPKSLEIEDSLADEFGLTRSRLKDVVCRISGFPPNDVIVSLNKCAIRDTDPDAADYVVFLDTCPNESFEEKANDLCREIALALVGLGLTENRIVEVWTRFLPGPWCLISNNKIVDTVGHPRTG